jgi:U4/U6.U5 tri-snRNP-associated protein 3
MGERDKDQYGRDRKDPRDGREVHMDGHRRERDNFRHGRVRDDFRRRESHYDKIDEGERRERREYDEYKRIDRRDRTHRSRDSSRSPNRVYPAKKNTSPTRKVEIRNPIKPSLDVEQEIISFQPIATIVDKELDEEEQMRKLMGFGGFESTKVTLLITKGKHVPGTDVSATAVTKQRKFRQFMNRFRGDREQTPPK